MPLKPIFDKSPLMTLKSVPLRPGQARVRLPQMQTLYAMTAHAQEQPALWEGAFRLACLLKAAPEQEPVAQWIQSVMARQKDDGSLPLPLPETVTVLRAAWALYAYTVSRPLLERLVKWCGWACDHWEALLKEPSIRVRPAELMELLSDLYRCTGVKPLLTLCERLRSQSMDWSGALHTFSVQQAMRRMMPWQELEQGMMNEENSETGFYTRHYLTCHGETLADGMRSAVVTGRYSGSGSELTAAKTGWERIVRYHGAACGGFTSEEMLGGASPASAVSAPALGALAEALAAQDDVWAYDALEQLLHNGMPAAVTSDDVVVFQRVNGLQEDCGAADCYHVEEDAYDRALQRLCRGYAAAASSAVTCRSDGLAINIFLPGRYAVPQKEGMLVLSVSGDKDQYTVTVHTRQPLRAVVYLRVPSWTKNAAVAINGLQMEVKCVDMHVHFDRVWNDGDVVTLDLERSLRVMEGYHQSACVAYGPHVMALPVQESGSWNMALCGVPELNAEGEVTATLCRVPSWKKKGAVPADVPVLPATEGESMQAVLRPYAETPCRMTMLPRGRQA